jgi:hypothetical protein
MVYFEAFTPFFAAHLGRLQREPCGITRGKGIPVDLDLPLVDVSNKSR